MFRALLFPAVLLSLAGGTALAARAASFDCAKAETPDEIAVCNAPGLSQLDTEMDALWFTYERIPFLMGASAARKDEAKAFLERRSACGADEACLRKAYAERIQALKRGIADWLREDATQAAGAPPPAWSAATLPGAVQAIVAQYGQQCTSLGGTLEAGADRPLIMTADLDGDGIQDFVLDPEDMQCSAAATAFCGNGGCDMFLALSRENYENPAEILGGAPSLGRKGEDGTVLDVWVHHTKCDGIDAEGSCRARYSWKDGKLSTTYQARKHEE